MYGHGAPAHQRDPCLVWDAHRALWAGYQPRLLAKSLRGGAGGGGRPESNTAIQQYCCIALQTRGLNLSLHMYCITAVQPYCCTALLRQSSDTSGSARPNRPPAGYLSRSRKPRCWRWRCLRMWTLRMCRSGRISSQGAAAAGPAGGPPHTGQRHPRKNNYGVSLRNSFQAVLHGCMAEGGYCPLF